MTDEQDIGAIANSVMDQYQEQLNKAIKDHENLLNKSRENLAALVAESNQQMADLAARLHGKTEPQKQGPEVAWVAATPDGKKDHLVLNPQAIQMIDKLFTAINEVLPELAKLVKKR